MIIDNPQDIKKILVMQLGPFGDILLTTSYFEFLKKKYPNSKITYLIKKKFLLIVNDHPFIDDFMFLSKEKGISYFLERIITIFQIRKKKYDIIIDQQNLMSTKIFTFFSRAEWKLGYKKSRCDFVYNVKVDRDSQRYTASARFDMVKPLGIELDSYRLYYYITPESDKYISEWLGRKMNGKFLVISPGSPVYWKKWDIKLYAAAADRVSSEFNLTCVWLWGPHEKADAQQGMLLMKHSSVLAPPTSLNQAAALLKKAELLLCNDGGINHLAAAVGVKTIALFGATDPVVWSPASEFSTHHYLHNLNNDAKREPSFGIKVDDVLAMVKEVLHG